MKSQVDGISVRVDRMERELEYLENKFPNQPVIEMDEVLLEQQIQAAELDLLKKKAKIMIDKGLSVQSQEYVLSYFREERQEIFFS